ncbi:hypothetical protein TOPH_06648 [Tolypocladium ophioglossoides CBS 100239]|uniref:Kelch repeat-containing protein n=1 Tax=Tolypocladium ophioglossoides (strain CBS 100239) TaxID=1163406 RepID=A0A0L0N3Y2_TOLOC|nr:hypothetical protein TOPH_06648 [Tolypocladium ophioglossoides CBS 100239]
MKHHGALSWGLLALLATPSVAQFSNWVPHQINTTICYWEQPRAALIRDIVYLDGGNIWWSPGLDSGQVGTVVNPGNYQGLILTYNLSEPFSPDTNVTGILLKNELSKAIGGTANGISSEPNYYDGAMLANNAEFYLDGGAVFRNDKLYEQPAADAALKYQAYQYGVNKPLWQRGFLDTRLGDHITRYIAYGAAVNAPSENKAWYFSGLTSPTRGPIIFNTGLNDSAMAVNISNTLISLDMSTQLSEEWSNSTLPSYIKGRSNAEVVWVPIGKQGILVVLGGVTYPEWASVSHKSADADASGKESPEFMSTIDIYDVAGNKWYKQPTKDAPGTRSRGCAIVAAAADRSSINIYYYGGFDGIHPTNDFYDDVWVLSLPSFTWTQINNGTAIHGRAGHKCFQPYPDQMMVFGGYTPQAGHLPSCLDKGPVVIFNITSGEWMDSYDPTKHGSYGVHEKVRAAIGGDASGGATVTKPVPSGWATSGLGDVFAQKYDTNKITTYWPYGAAPATGRPDLPKDKDDDGGDDKRHIIIPAVVVPIVFLVGVGLIAWRCLLNRRKRDGSVSKESGPDEAAMRIRSWIRGQHPEKTITMTTSDAMSPSPEIGKAPSVAPMSPETERSVHHEMEDTQVAELGGKSGIFADTWRGTLLTIADTSPPAELHDTGLSPIEVIQKHSNFAQNKTRSPTDPSHSSFSFADNTSFVSRTSGAANSARVDSPLLGNSSPILGVSRPAVGDSGPREHMQTMHEGREEMKTPAPVSPPTAGEVPADDYISVGEVPISAKKSVFHENDEDMGRLK